MKKIFSAWILTLVMSLLCALPALAETVDLPVLSGTSEAESKTQTAAPQAADFDLAALDSASQAGFAEAVKSGRRLFDMPGYLDSDKAADIEARLKNITAKYGQDAAVIMTYGRPSGMDMEAFADKLYAAGGFGTDAERSGSILVIDYLNGEYRVYAQGGAMRYFTDKAIDEITKTRNGGIENGLNDYRDYEALVTYTQNVSDLYAQGIQQDQYNYDPETGEKDPAYEAPKKPFIKLWQVIVSLIVSLLAGYLPIRSIRKQYAMEAEKKAAQSLSVAYRMASAYVFSQLSQDRMLDRKVTRRVMMTPTNNSRPGGNRPPFGGGQSTMHHSTGGGHHTSGGGSFRGR